MFEPTNTSITRMFGISGGEYMGMVSEMPCVVSGRYPVEVHHCFCGRFSTARTSDFDTIPLHHAFHTGLFDTSGIAIHKQKATWVGMYGFDWSYIPQVREAIRVSIEQMIGGRL